MSFQKFKADQLFDGHKLRDDSVLITDENGVIEDIVSVDEAGDGIHHFSGILSPGFINCHCHLELSHMRGLIPEHTGLIDFVWHVVSQRHFPEASILEAITVAEREMVNNGIVAVGDICNTTHTLAQKKEGNIYYHNFIEASGFNPTIADARFAKSLEYFREFGANYPIPVESNSIVPHAPYSVADELWDHIVNFPGNHLLTIHNQETIEETELFVRGTGDFYTLYEKMGLDISFFQHSKKSSLQTFLPRMLMNQSLILVHNVHTTGDDVAFANKTGMELYWCLCPNANRYISNTLPDIELFVRNNSMIVLGTDSLASNHQLSILAEMQTISAAYPSISLGTMLQWATLNGARALQMDSMLGSFEKGKAPGCVLIDEPLSSAKKIF